MYGFGDFRILCDNAEVPLCALIGPYEGAAGALGAGLASKCYTRSIDLANTLILNVGNVFLQLGTMLVLTIIIYNSYQKYTAVGRREMLDTLYLYFVLTFWSLVVDSGVTPPTSGVYPYFVAIQAGLASALCLILLLTGLLGYQFWEDGSFRSVWGIRMATVIYGAGNFVVAILTFKGWAHGLGPSHTVGLMALLYVVNAALLVLFACESLYLTTFVLREWWAMGAQLLGFGLFVAGQVIMYVFGGIICQKVKHYVDGIFFATVCNGFAILMIYKAWDITTAEDLEFSVSSAENSWDLKGAADDAGLADGESEYAMSNYNHQTPWI